MFSCFRFVYTALVYLNEPFSDSLKLVFHLLVHVIFLIFSGSNP